MSPQGGIGFGKTYRRASSGACALRSRLPEAVWACGNGLSSFSYRMPVKRRTLAGPAGGACRDASLRGVK